MSAKDSRLYGKFTLDFPHHPKVFILSDAAFRMLVEMTLYSRQMLTDGRVSKRLAHAKWSLEAARELLDNDHEKPSLYEDGEDYIIHDFADHQTTTADIEAKRAAGAKGGRAKAARAKSQATGSRGRKPASSSSSSLAGAKAGAKGSAKQMPSKTLAKTETETYIKKEEKKNPPLAIIPPVDTQDDAPGDVLGDAQDVTQDDAPQDLPTAPVFDPTEWTTADNPRCKTHYRLNIGEEPRCTGCGRVRRFFEERDAWRAHQAKAERASSIDACSHCDETGWIDTHDTAGNPVALKCSHDGPPPVIEADPDPEPARKSTWAPSGDWHSRVRAAASRE